DAICEHHGLRAGAVRDFYRATVCHGAAGDVVEARDALGRIPGAAGWSGVVGDDVPADESDQSAAMGTCLRAFAAGEGTRARHVPGVVVVLDLRGRDGAGDA